MSIQDRVEAIIHEHGAPMIYTRQSEGSALTVYGKRQPGTGVGMDGTSRQQTFAVLISTQELLASSWANKSPRKGDQITVDGKPRSVIDADPYGDGPTTMIWQLSVGG